MGVGSAVLAVYLVVKPWLDPKALPWLAGYAICVGLVAAAIPTGFYTRRRWVNLVGWATVASLPVLVAAFFHWMWWMTLTGVEIQYGWAQLFPITVVGFGSLSPSERSDRLVPLFRSHQVTFSPGVLLRSRVVK